MKEQDAKSKTPARADEKTTFLIKMREGDIQDGPASRAVGGSFVDEFNMALVNQTLRTFWNPGAPASDRDLWIKATRDLATYGHAGIRPQNELEGMIAAQMIAAHAAAMECYRRAAITDQGFESRNANINLASKASRTFATLTESLQRLRGQTGTQTVHVHHHTDARTQVAAKQAVVHVSLPGEGESKKSRQPQEPEAITHDPAETFDLSEPLRSKEPAGKAMPMSGDAEQEAVPPARRKKSGRA